MHRIDSLSPRWLICKSNIFMICFKQYQSDIQHSYTEALSLLGHWVTDREVK